MIAVALDSVQLLGLVLGGFCLGFVIAEVLR